MKIKFLSALLTALLLGGSSHGQAVAAQPPQSVADQTREMSNKLQLNEGQYIKLYTINRTRLSRQEEIEHATSQDLSARTAQLAELQMQYEQECARILTPSQLSLLQQDQSPAAANDQS